MNQPDPTETDEQRADREETERDHARGDHTYCGITCEVELPTEHLRNFVISKGYPGTKGALDELLRRVRAEAALEELRRMAAGAQQQPGRCPHGCDVTHCPCLACEADGEAQQEPTDQDVVEAHRLALSEALHLGNGAPWDAILDRAGDLSRRDVEAQQPDTEVLAAALDGLHTLVATSSRDWQTYRVDAWLWAVLCGWDCEASEHDETCTHGALEETAAMHGWDDDTVAKARRYRTAVRALTDPSPVAQQPAALPPCEGPEYTPCACDHIEPEHQPDAGACMVCDCGAYGATPPAPLRRSEDECPGFPERCPNLRAVDPNPPVHLGGIRCGCADA